MRDTPSGVRHPRREHAYRRTVQSPSSLIFLVLLGVWAAYFVQYWIRRRDHLATARSVEQFSAAMRVLERRATIPRTDLSDPTPRSWSVHPARTARPQVVVKRAVPAEIPSPRPVSARVADAARPTSRPAAGRRRARGLTLLTSLSALVLTGVLAAVAVVPPWVPVVALVAVVGAFAWLRAGVRAEQATRAASRRRAREEARRRASAAPARPARPANARPETPAESVVTASTSAATAPAEAPAVADTAVQREASAPQAPVEVVAAAPAPEPEPEPETVIEYVHLVDEDDIPLTWEPVPVPRPTYTMKARAERPEVPPAAVTPDPVPVEGLRAHGEAFDERRVAGA